MGGGAQFTRGAPVNTGIGGLGFGAAPAESKTDGGLVKDEAAESKRDGDHRSDRDRADRDRGYGRDRSDRDRDYNDRDRDRDYNDRGRDRDRDSRDGKDNRRSRDFDRDTTRRSREFDRDRDEDRRPPVNVTRGPSNVENDFQNRRELSPGALTRRVKGDVRSPVGSDSDAEEDNANRPSKSRVSRERSSSPEPVRSRVSQKEQPVSQKEQPVSQQERRSEDIESSSDDGSDDERNSDDCEPAEAKGTGASDRKRSSGAKGMGIGDEADAKEGAVSSGLDLSDMRKFLMQPATPDQGIVQCHIKRNKAGRNSKFPEYCLYLRDGNRFLMCSKKRRHQKTANYLVSMQRGDMDRGSTNTLGKLRANFLGTEFTIYDNGINPKDTFGQEDQNIREELGIVMYAKNVLGSKAPRKMKVCVPKVDEETGPGGLPARAVWKPTRKQDEMSSKCKDSDHTNMVVLNNKKPQWNDQVGAHVLDFGGRVTMASVKNFQLVSPEDQDSIMLQFGRVGKDEFTMDYQWPLSPFQAFAITLSSFDSKLACDS